MQRVYPALWNDVQDRYYYTAAMALLIMGTGCHLYDVDSCGDDVTNSCLRKNARQSHHVWEYVQLGDICVHGYCERYIGYSINVPVHHNAIMNAFANLARMLNTKCVNFRHNAWIDHHILILNNVPELETIHNCGRINDIIQYTERNDTLNSLSMNCVLNGLFLQWLQTGCTLQFLDISNSFVDVDSVLTIVAHNNVLQSLKLPRDACGVNALANVLKYNTTLTQLQIGVVEKSCLVECLMQTSVHSRIRNFTSLSCMTHISDIVWEYTNIEKYNSLLCGKNYNYMRNNRKLIELCSEKLM